MQFFVYCRDRGDAGDARRVLLKDHWAFMDRYVDAMIARGPTMSSDGSAMTGSMHIVDLPDANAARVFVHDDPFAKAGLFEEIIVRRYHNVLGRTMWQFNGDPNNQRFLFVGQMHPGMSGGGRHVLGAQRTYLGHADLADRVILFGPLFAGDGESWEGTAILLEASDTAAAETLVLGDPAATAGLYARTGLYPWRFGGAQNLRGFAARS
jgi:uncharacterized protein YciI